MIMSDSYLFDVKERISETPDEVFHTAGTTKEEVLNNQYIMERLWYKYQKSIEEYECDAWYSYSDALKDVLNIDYTPDVPL